MLLLLVSHKQAKPDIVDERPGKFTFPLPFLYSPQYTETQVVLQYFSAYLPR